MALWEGKNSYNIMGEAEYGARPSTGVNQWVSTGVTKGFLMYASL